MTCTCVDRARARATVGGVEAWLPLAECVARAPSDLVPWLAEPGLLTARVRAACAASSFRLLRLAPADLSSALQARLGVTDSRCLSREVEFACGPTRWVYAQSVFPQSTVDRYPWLAELGETPLGEALRRVADVEREPLEYAELPCDHELARAAEPRGEVALWARRAVYRLAGDPIAVQEVFLPALARGCAEEAR